MRALLLILMSASALAAETPMTVQEFETWSTGKTLTYSANGEVWGSETHLAGRATLDDGDGDICRRGQWQPQGDAICFTYEADPGRYCWRFFRDGDTVVATIGYGFLASSYVVTVSKAPVSCDVEVGV